MWKLVSYRLAAAVPLLLVTSVLIFLLVYLVPGNPAVVVLGEGATPEAIAKAEQRMGLDKPIPEQYLLWMRGMLSGDFGSSLFDGRSVAQMVLARLPITASLAMLGLGLSLVIGLPLGIAAAVRRGSSMDRLFTAISSIGLSVPGFWLALLFMLVFAVKLNWLPVAGYVPTSDGLGAWLASLAMPALALSLPAGAVIARHTRSAVIEALEAPYMQTVRALGLSGRTALLRYALKNAMGPILTVFGFQASHAIGGAAVLEILFALPGLGNLLVLSVIDKDFPMVRAITMMSAVFMVLVYLVVDLGYGYFDPRVRSA